MAWVSGKHAADFTVSLLVSCLFMPRRESSHSSMLSCSPLLHNIRGGISILILVLRSLIFIPTQWVNWQLGCKQKGKVRASEERAEEEKAGDGKTSARGFAAFDAARGAGTAADREGDERTCGYGATSQSEAFGGSRKVAHASRPPPVSNKHASWPKCSGRPIAKGTRRRPGR
jgi:hypothetical protein